MGGRLSLSFFFAFLGIHISFKAKVVVDGKLITGQNPASAKPLGNVLLKALKA